MQRATPSESRCSTALFEGTNDNDNDDSNGAWDENVDYEKEWPSGKDTSVPDPGTSWDTLPNALGADFLGNDATELLGIDLELEPLSEAEANKLRNDARQIVEDAINAGVEDIESLKAKMKRELDASRRAMSLASELEAKRQTDRLLSKIDSMTGDFLKATESTRKSTKMAAAASRAMEGTNGSKARGLEVGTWGVLGGRTVVADDDRARSGSGLLGSIGNAIRENDLAEASNKMGLDDSDLLGSLQADQAEDTVVVQENRILILADMQKDKLAKALVPALTKTLEKECEDGNIPELKIDVLAPLTANMPLGGNDAACVVVFCPGLNDPDALKKMLDRLLRKTLGTGGGKLGTPPTQLVGISTLGTERFDIFPYSVQNFLGGKLEKRRQIEEVLINTVRNRVVEPPLDYTIIKVKEDGFAADGSGGSPDFSLLPGDALDDATSIETAAQVILQALAYQPPARNSTMSVSGSLPSSLFLQDDQDDFWTETFTSLDGPEVWRSVVFDSPPLGEDGVVSETLADYYDQLSEYLKEWASLLASTGKGLTTPIRAETDTGLDPTSMVTPANSRTILYQVGVRLLFLPTNTGKNYVSREEEARREREGRKTTKASPKIAKEGGIDVVVEIVNLPGMDGREARQQLRVRARRTNYAPDAIIKELSETTIVKRLEDAIQVFVDQNVV